MRDEFIYIDIHIKKEENKRRQQERIEAVTYRQVQSANSSRVDLVGFLYIFFALSGESFSFFCTENF